MGLAVEINIGDGTKEVGVQLGSGVVLGYQLLHTEHEDLASFNEDLVEDYVQLAKLALRCGCDQDRLWATVQQMSPTLYKECLVVLDAWAKSADD